MNRIFLSVFFVAIFSARASGQEADTLSRQPAADTLSPTGKLYIVRSDTLTEVYGRDTVTRVREGVRLQADTVTVEEDVSHSPTKAIMFALVLPGLGQAYNRKYYKIPIVWAAIGGAGWAINFNTQQYKEYSKGFVDNPGEYSERGLQYWRRNMELSYIAMIAVYALQVIDAYVDAQLYSWDVNEELSMGISPTLQPLMAPGSLTGHAYGLTCSFKLKR